MPAKVSLGSASVTSVKQSSFVLIPRRAQVLANLRPGQMLNVQVLEKFADGQVMLNIKGAAVTAQAKGSFQVGEQVQVRIGQQGNTYVLQRVDQPDAALTESLARVVRGRIAGMEQRAQALSAMLNNRAVGMLADAKSGLAGMLARIQTMTGELFVVDSGFSDKLAALAVLMGLSPASGGDRLREALGRNLPGLLDRVLSAGKKQWASLLGKYPELTAEDLEGLSNSAGQLKEQIGLFRALNGLFEARDQPLYMSIPFVYNGEPQPTDLWVYKRHDAHEGKDDDQAVSVLLRLRMSRLGEVRALLVVRGSAVEANIYTENETAGEQIKQALPELEKNLSAAGLKSRVQVVDSLAEAPDQDLQQMLYSTASDHTVSVKI